MAKQPMNRKHKFSFVNLLRSPQNPGVFRGWGEAMLRSETAFNGMPAEGSDALSAAEAAKESSELASAGAPTVVTDQPDYSPGEQVLITASGFQPGDTISFAIADDPSDPGDDGDADVYAPFSVTDGGIGDLDGEVNGTVVASWQVPSDDDGSGLGVPDALNATLNLTATGSSGAVATVTFTDSLPAAATSTSTTLSKR